MIYRVLEATTADELAQKVAIYVNQHKSRPLGGVSAYYNPHAGLLGKTFYTQAVVFLEGHEAI